MASGDFDPTERSRRPRRIVATAVTTVALAVGLGGAMAIAGGPAGGGGSHGSAASGEYRPGKGCGDTNHIHTGPPGNPSNTDCPH